MDGEETNEYDIVYDTLRASSTKEFLKRYFVKRDERVLFCDLCSSVSFSFSPSLQVEDGSKIFPTYVTDSPFRRAEVE